MNNKELTQEYLMEIHPELDAFSAGQLLEFCKEHTIRHEICYGDGSIMYPKWQTTKK